MGGGDLNLKKSWHPHTMKNQEKVWKAQQAKNQEERKMNDLRKEIEDEKSREDLKRHGEASGVLAKSDGDKKLEWMYKSSTDLINRDEYLTGRKIDKSFETLQAEEKQRDQNMVGVKQSINHVDHECVPFSIRSYRNVESTEQVDLQRKVMEDPLMLIKQREMESRRKLLENPVKLKELHRILKTDQVLQKAKKNKKEKKAKKSKKKHKKRERSSSSSSTNSDSDKDLDKKLEKKLKGSNLISNEEKLVGLNITKLLDAKYETLSKELDKAANSKSSNNTKERRDRSSSANSVSSSERRRNQHRRQDERQSTDRGRNHQYRQQYERRRYRSRSRTQNQRNSVRNRSHDRRRTRSRSPQTERRQRKRTESPENRRQLKRSPPPRANREYNKPTTSTKLTEEEKEARRREMMQNAAWRETDRTKSVQKHRDAYAREEQQNRARDFDKDFINKEVKKAIANQNSVESRIRSNLNNIQRTSAAMNSNFTRKY